MGLLRRLILVPCALLLAIPAGMVALGAAGLADPAIGAFLNDVAWSEAAAFADSLSDGEMSAGRFAASWGWAFSLLVVPPLLIGLIGEVIGLRTLAWYAGATGAVTSALPWLMREGERAPTAGEGRVTLALFLVGAASGLVYWLVAGRGAGERALSAPASSGS